MPRTARKTKPSLKINAMSDEQRLRPGSKQSWRINKYWRLTLYLEFCFYPRITSRLRFFIQYQSERDVNVRSEEGKREGEINSI